LIQKTLKKRGQKINDSNKEYIGVTEFLPRKPLEFIPQLYPQQHRFNEKEFYQKKDIKFLAFVSDAAGWRDPNLVTNAQSN